MQQPSFSRVLSVLRVMLTVLLIVCGRSRGLNVDSSQ
ncbi:hypothetical protein BVRB_019080 [Beta vulgaris subsp. vulgaris]|uniref:Uncharacterized protein n=1 Tax=Beta vulgaris subsp. vulgaris TaxID=3555 RepID=A0A0J7YLP4_BETVV|nr:hypothetical protein BVRB_019080 [Beta vulgaris subsp. vulgaris]